MIMTILYSLSTLGTSLNIPYYLFYVHYNDMLRIKIELSKVDGINMHGLAKQDKVIFQEM